ncbi:MAG TPA: YSC84-related protein [Pseudomonadales bacterium]|jgi:lipid-binding SYLF domain-containing protein
MRMAIGFATLCIVLTLPSEANSAFGKKKSPEERRENITEMREDVLNRLYDERASAKAQVQDSVGYAVFSNTGVNLFLLSTANGAGVAHDNGAGKDIFMNMFSAGGGIGLGVKKFSAVFIFHTRDAFDQFVEEGWNFTGQADAAATTDAEEDEQVGAAGGTVGINDGVTVYQMTEKGLALQATLQGTKYWKNEDLNN